MVEGPVAMASLLWHRHSLQRYKKEKEKKKTNTNLTAATILFTRPRKWDVSVYVTQNWKDPWSDVCFFSGKRTAGKCSQLVDWYQWHQNLHSSHHSSSELALAQPHARLATQPPASFFHFTFAVASHVLSVFSVCVRLIYLSQTRRWSCGRSVRETSVQRATTWKMRMDESEIRRPSPHYG